MCNYKYGHAIWFKKGRIAIGSLHKTARQFVGSLLVVGSLDNLPKTTNLAGFGNLPLSTIYLFLSYGNMVPAPNGAQIVSLNR